MRARLFGEARRVLRDGVRGRGLGLLLSLGAACESGTIALDGATTIAAVDAAVLADATVEVADGGCSSSDTRDINGILADAIINSGATCADHCRTAGLRCVDVCTRGTLVGFSGLLSCRDTQQYERLELRCDEIVGTNGRPCGLVQEAHCFCAPGGG